ncbi:plasmid transfer protein TraA [Streptomyces californicus]
MSTPSEQVRNFAQHQADQPFTAPPRPRTAPSNDVHPGGVNNSTNRTGGAFAPSLGLSVNKTTVVNGTGGTGGPGRGAGGKVPGSDFMSNEDIRAYCEYHRKQSRNGATELAMDSDHLESILRTIADSNGTLGGSRARARRVVRWLKKAAAAEKAKQKYFAALYGTFEQEYDSNLRTVGKGRNRPPAPSKFGWR